MPALSTSLLLPAARKRSWWRSAVAALAALSFLLLVTASVSHVHKSSSTIHDCAVCAVVADQLADPPAPVLLVAQTALTLRYVLPLPVACVLRSAVRWLPPGRGPPSHSV